MIATQPIEHNLIIFTDHCRPSESGITDDQTEHIDQIAANQTEHIDLSEKLPDVMKALEDRLQYYMKGAVPSLYRPRDPRAVTKVLSEGI